MHLARLAKATPHLLKPQIHQVLKCRYFSSSFRRDVDFSHTIIGGGVVGLAIAHRLSSRPNTNVLLIERHGSVGTETSSRNSEVIHAGLYYGPESLKTRLCIRGKHMLYELCEKHRIPFRRTGKWIVAQDDAQMRELERIHDFAKGNGVPTRFLSREERERREPDVRALAGVLESESTGIVDSHSLMKWLEGGVQDLGGEIVFHTSVESIEPISDDGESGYRLRIRPFAADNNSNTTGDDDGVGVECSDNETDSITTSVLINSAGLSAINISNRVLPTHRHIKPHYAKGTYFSYSSSFPKPKTLLYPAPIPGLGGLGTHLTLDMAGRVRFGPDVEWVDDPTDLTPNPKRLNEALNMIQTYLPGIDKEAVVVDYCGMRPKLGRSAGTVSGTSNSSQSGSPEAKDGISFSDFYIREESADGRKNFVNLLGIESPGLTSSLAIAEMVDEMLHK